MLQVQPNAFRQKGDSDMEENYRKEQLDLGYDALAKGRWNKAMDIFGALLREDPHCGLSCLGIAMAVKRIHSRQELAEKWELLRQDPDFQRELQPAPPDFHQWISQDMAEAGMQNLQDPGTETDEELKFRLPDFSLMDTGRKRLLIFAGVQIVLFLLSAVYFGKFSGEETFPGKLLAGFVLSAIFCGLPVIMGPLYGNAVLKNWRFCRILKFINNTLCIFGAGLHAMLAVACYMSIYSGADTPEDRYFLCISVLGVLIHIISAVFPAFLQREE